jgi:hypothetical protein
MKEDRGIAPGADAKSLCDPISPVGDGLYVESGAQADAASAATTSAAKEMRAAFFAMRLRMRAMDRRISFVARCAMAATPDIPEMQWACRRDGRSQIWFVNGSSYRRMRKGKRVCVCTRALRFARNSGQGNRIDKMAHGHCLERTVYGDIPMGGCVARKA